VNKKKQKNFIRLRFARPGQGGHGVGDESFLVLFFKKERACLLACDFDGSDSAVSINNHFFCHVVYR
jgi:hypothetical protein